MTDYIDTVQPTEAEVFGGVPYHSKLFRVLSSQSCRYTIYYFLASEEPSSAIGDLLSGVQCILGYGSRRTCLVDDDRLASLLATTTLPALSEIDVVEFDPRTQTVRYCVQPTVEEFAEHAAYQELSESFVRDHLFVDESLC